jgi:AcrR family transcriptional regulator
MVASLHAPDASPPSADSPKALASKRRYAGASAQERQDQRRARLIEASYDVFGTEGYANATMRLVCAKARLTERYFYENFNSLYDLFVVVHRRISSQCAKLIEARRNEVPDVDPLGKSRVSIQAFLEFIKEDPRRARIMLTDAVTTGLSSVSNVHAAVNTYVPYLRNRIDMFFPHLKQADMGLDLELVASGLIGLIIHVSTVWAEKGFVTPVEKVLDHIIYAWRGLSLWLEENNTPPAKP